MFARMFIASGFLYVQGNDPLSLYAKEKVAKRSAPKRGLLQSRPLFGISPPVDNDVRTS
jgi:hypothetical protein